MAGLTVYSKSGTVALFSTSCLCPSILQNTGVGAWLASPSKVTRDQSGLKMRSWCFIDGSQLSPNVFPLNSLC